MAYEIKIERTDKSRLHDIDINNAPFGRVFADHMLMADYRDGGWHDVRIVPFGPLTLSPATTALHYGQEIFEGLKAYRSPLGKPLLFRPDANHRRMNKSAERMGMPSIPREIFVDGLKKLIEIDQDWIPTVESGSLYLRPFMFATDEYVGIKASDTYTFIAFSAPVTAYYSEPVRVKVERVYSRAVKGGTGEAKTAGNYAASLYPVSQANKEGFRQMLWTDCHEHKYIEESGTMNVFFAIGNKVITPSLTGSILDGITRDCVMTLLRENGYDLEERPITVDEVAEAHRRGDLREAFGAGTAATIAPISAIGVDDKVLDLPPVQDWKIAPWLLEELEDIRRGRKPDTHGWVVEINSQVTSPAG